MRSLHHLSHMLTTLFLSIASTVAAHTQETPPTKEDAALAAVVTIKSIDADESISREVRTQKIVDLCTTFNTTIVDARTLAFAVFNNIDHHRGTPAKLGTEICLARASNLPIYASMRTIALDIVRNRLVSVHGMGITFPQDIPKERQYSSPWVASYLTGLGKEFWETYKKPLRITSLVRTTKIQKRLAQRGRTPADCETPARCSTHTSGASFDISMQNLSKEEDEWITQRLVADMHAGKVLFIAERRGAHFHVFMPKPKE